jgi:hypothetical protein
VSGFTLISTMSCGLKDSTATFTLKKLAAIAVVGG